MSEFKRLVLTLHHDTVFVLTDSRTDEVIGKIRRSKHDRNKGSQTKLTLDFPEHIKISREKE